MRSFDDPARAIHVQVDEAFAIRLAGNPTTGYVWQAEADDRYLEPLGQEFEPAAPGVGAGGHEVCRFRALEPCQTEIVFEHRRPWGEVARDTRRFQVRIE
jgi:predicted secreted protein